MKRNTFRLPVVLALVVWAVSSAGAAHGTGITVGHARSLTSDLSLKFEVQHAIERGLSWLQKNQQPGGYWCHPDYPALTGLVLIAFMGEPTGSVKAHVPEYIIKGYDYLLRNVQPDGGIYVNDQANYNTAVSMMALTVASNPAYEPVLLSARNFIVNKQSDFDENWLSGGLFDDAGYGGRTYEHSEISHAMNDLEALYYTKFISKDRSATETKSKEFNWIEAIKFIDRCHNLLQANDHAWASDEPQNKGEGFRFSGDNKAGKLQPASGMKVSRSYAGISCAGLLSYAYADLRKNDVRVQAVIEWLKSNYNFEDDPGVGQEGLFYYYHTMAKALAAFGVDEVILPNGKRINWRKDLALRLLDLQKAEGMWMNESGIWWERDPNLVTAYAVIVLDIVHRGL